MKKKTEKGGKRRKKGREGKKRIPFGQSLINKRMKKGPVPQFVKHET